MTHKLIVFSILVVIIASNYWEGRGSEGAIAPPNLKSWCRHCAQMRRIDRLYGLQQGRIQEFCTGGPHGERGARAYNGGLGASPQWGPGAKPLVRGSGGRSPPEAESFLIF